MTPMPTRELDSNPAASLDEKFFTHRQWVRAPSRLSSTGPPCGELVFSNFIFAPDRASDRGPPASWSLRIRVPVYEPEAYFLPVYRSSKSMVSHYRVDHAAYNQSRWESVSLQKGEGRPGASGAFMTTITPSFRIGNRAQSCSTIGSARHIIILVSGATIHRIP
ncbi:hypothetical protein DTO063F5_6638 [Paecilomyces variotii]|nr:hypothetical protein DTO063F5_6638 [Paecilomyces variotii]